MKVHFFKNAVLGLTLALAPILGWAGTAASSDSTAASQTVMADSKKVPPELEGIGVKEHLGEKLDIQNLLFTDSESGALVPLAQYFTSGKPTLLNLVYYECPMLCTMVLNGVNDGMRGLGWTIGSEFNVVTVSIDPKETSEMAKDKKRVYVNAYLKDSKRDAALVNAGWSFLTGSEDQIQKLASGLGFEFKYDKLQDEYAHPAVTFVMTPDGVISRYLYGITYRPQDLKLALLEASQGKIGTVFDRLLMFCYHYEPLARGYSLQAMKVMQLAALGTFALLCGYLMMFWTRQRKGNAK